MNVGDRQPRLVLSRSLGSLSIAFFLAHLLWHFSLGDPQNALWACHIASLLIGIGGLINNPSLIAIGLMWLVVGIPLWLYHLIVGGPFVPTSLLTHIGAVIVGCLLLRNLRLEDRSGTIWWRSSLAVATLVTITRLTTRRTDNINLAFDIHGRDDTTMVEHGQYLLVMSVVVSITFFASERIFRRIFSKPCDTS